MSKVLVAVTMATIPQEAESLLSKLLGARVEPEVVDISFDTGVRCLMGGGKCLAMVETFAHIDNEETDPILSIKAA